MSASDPLSRAVARVEPLTLVLGAAGAVYEFSVAGWRSGLAIAVGAVISWLNYRWLRAGVMALTPAPATAPDAASAPNAASARPANAAGAPIKSPPPSAKGILKFLARLALLLVALYVILSRSLLPASPLLAGLFAAVAAVILQMVYLLATGGVAKGN